MKKINGCNKNKSALASLLNACNLAYCLIQTPSHKSFGEQKGKLKIKNDSGERAEGERKGRKDEFSDEI